MCMPEKSNTHIIVIIILSVVSMLILSDVLAGSRPICDYCRREIANSSYISVDNKYFHTEHFLCAGCSKSLADQKFFKKDNKYYCENCFIEKFVPRCQKCGEPIQGRYYEFDNKIYHKKCYEKFIAPRCSLCREIIDGEYLADFWGNKYHKYHQGQDPICSYCGRYISESVSRGGYRYDDGRYICGICKKSAVDDNREAEKLMTFISQKMKNFGIEIEPNKIELELVDKNRLDRLSSIRTKGNAGLTTFEGTTIDGNVVSRKFNIYILHGMPEKNFRATMAHELMHVWLYGQAPMEMDPALTEGSCNYASYLLLQNDRDKQVAYILDSMEQDPDIFYGDGYRRVKKMVRRIGVEAWLEFLKKNKNFPSGY